MVDATVRAFTKSTYEKKIVYRVLLIRDLDELFLSWQIKDLRLKAITFLSLFLQCYDHRTSSLGQL